MRNVKLLSLASLAATVCGTPLLLELASPDMLPEAKMTISLVVDGFGTFTTALLQWFVSPYVLTMRVEKGKENAKEPRGGASFLQTNCVGDVVVVEKLTLFARRFEDRFPASAMREAKDDAAAGDVGGERDVPLRGDGKRPEAHVRQARPRAVR